MGDTVSPTNRCYEHTSVRRPAGRTTRSGQTSDVFRVAARHSLTEAAATAVARQKQAGYVAIKLYSRLSAQQIVAIGRAAREVGSPVVGHGSPNYALEELARWQSNSHFATPATHPL